MRIGLSHRRTVVVVQWRRWRERIKAIPLRPCEKANAALCASPGRALSSSVFACDAFFCASQRAHNASND
ncbi:hypothetical protein GLE_3428 [Lysobacter enzymogenes]|uniref:Uncharacterized protein n=1 Tax=Lysobacter enzymogenes TaxID=69 RepID=A0A0S2DJF5_LYSEN|nr:hypothetical protein GLE_3428 [Lysobacter enzymogenes]